MEQPPKEGKLIALYTRPKRQLVRLGAWLRNVARRTDEIEAESGRCVGVVTISLHGHSNARVSFHLPERHRARMIGMLQVVQARLVREILDDPTDERSTR